VGQTGKASQQCRWGLAMKIVMLGSGSYKSSLTYFRLVALARQLSYLGWQVSIIVPSADKYNDYKPDKNAHLKGIELVQPWQLATKSPVVNLLPYLLSSLIALIKRRADIIYIYKPTPITIIGLLPKLLFRTPVVLDLDDLGSEVMRLENQSAFDVKLVKLCESLCLRFASSVVVSSTYLQSSVTHKYPNKPVLVLSNGVDPSEFKQASKKNSQPSIYYFGAINRLSLVESFIKSLPLVVKAVPGTKINILGGGRALNELKNLVNELKISNSVGFSDWIEPEQIYNYVNFADIAICTQPDIPTVKAASNLKVFQYMALGSAVVVSKVGDLASYIGVETTQPAGVAVEVNNQRQLSEKLIDLLKDDVGRKAMAKNARKRAVNTYSWDNLAIKLDAFIKESTSADKLVAAKELKA
jgi:glycosyltransferase involved in cell wall biosynthesis